MNSNPLHLKRPPVSGKKAHTLDEINNSVLANGEKLTAISEDTSATRAITSATKAAVNKMQAKLDLAFKGPIALGKEVKAQRELTKRYVRRLRREQGANKELAAENAKLQLRLASRTSSGGSVGEHFSVKRKSSNTSTSSSSSGAGSSKRRKQNKPTPTDIVKCKAIEHKCSGA